MTATTGETSSDQDARLLAFFEARLDEDQAAARAACARRPSQVWKVDPEEWAAGVGIADEDNRSVAVAHGTYRAAHIARHDPTRALAEITIKRYLISEYRSVETFDEHAAVEAAMRLPDEQAAMTALQDAWTKAAARSLLLAVIKNEASLYALHPDYEAAWSLWPHVREHGVPQ